MATAIPSTAFTAYDLFDKVTKSVITDLEEGMDFFDTVLIQSGIYTQAEKDREEYLVKEVVRGDDIRVSHDLFIRVVHTGRDDEWQATQVRDNKYLFRIDACARNTAEGQVTDEEIVTFGHAVMNYTLRYSNLSPVIRGTSPKIRGYHAEANNLRFDTIELRGTYRRASFDYWIKVMNPYHGFTGVICD